MDELDLEALLVDAYPGLRRFAAVTGPSGMAPDDLVHDAIAATLASGGFDRAQNPEAYLRRVIVNLASNERRRLGRRRKALRRNAGGVDNGSADQYPSDLAYLNEVSPAARAILYLHYIDGESFEQIADSLGLQSGSVRQTAARARRQLQALEEEL